MTKIVIKIESESISIKDCLIATMQIIEDENLEKYLQNSYLASCFDYNAGLYAVKKTNRGNYEFYFQEIESTITTNN